MSPRPRPPCTACGMNEADEVFTVCSPCWDIQHPSKEQPATGAGPSGVDPHARNADWQRGFDAARQYVHTATEIVAECEADLAALREAAAALIAALPMCDHMNDDETFCQKPAMYTAEGEHNICAFEHCGTWDYGEVRYAAPLRALQEKLFRERGK